MCVNIERADLEKDAVFTGWIGEKRNEGDRQLGLAQIRSFGEIRMRWVFTRVIFFLLDFIYFIICLIIEEWVKIPI